MKPTATLLNVVVATTFVLGLARPALAQAPNACSVATLHGDYIVTGNAEFAPRGSGDPTTYPRLTLGGANFDGNGNITGWVTLAQGGDIIRVGPFTSTYTVSEDCRGTYVEGTLLWEFVVTRDGRHADFLRVDPGQIARRTYNRQ